MTDTTTTTTDEVADGPATVALGDILRVVSHHSKPFTITYDSRNYRLDPETDAFVPIEAVMLWFGDPRSTGTVQSMVDEKGIRSFVADRETEVRRVRTKWGIIGGDERLFEGTGGAVVPPVEVFDLNNRRIYTVVDDPAGDSTTLATPTVMQNADLAALVQRQQDQINRLIEIVSANQGTAAIAPTAPPAPPAPEGTETTTSGLPPDTEGQTSPTPPPTPASPAPDWWQATDGNWYPPEARPTP